MRKLVRKWLKIKDNSNNNTFNDLDRVKSLKTRQLKAELRDVQQKIDIQNLENQLTEVQQVGADLMGDDEEIEEEEGDSIENQMLKQLLPVIMAKFNPKGDGIPVDPMGNRFLDDEKIQAIARDLKAHAPKKVFDTFIHPMTQLGDADLLQLKNFLGKEEILENGDN